MSQPLKLMHVVAALLTTAERQFLVAQRPAGKLQAGRWELPGGKLEAGELPEAALARELQEELGIEIAQDQLTPLTFVSHSYHDLGLHVLMPIFACARWQGTACAREGQVLRWIKPEDMQTLPMVTADEGLAPIIAGYFSHLKQDA